MKRRFELLELLGESGRNRFRAVRATEVSALQHFPVFLREADEHTGPLTELLHDRREVERALVWVRMKGYRLRDLIAVEFCDTSDEAGIFRKYCAYNVGGRIVPRHVTCGRGWMVRHGTAQVDDANIQEEREYMRSNPHEAWLHETFELAGIDYGRADYALLDGQPQLWEINLNPTVGRVLHPRPGHQRLPEHIRALRQPARRAFYEQFQDALEAIDQPQGGDSIEIDVPRQVLARIEAERRRGRLARAHRATVQAALPLRRLLEPPVKKLCSLLARGER